MKDVVFGFCVGSLLLSNAFLLASILNPKSRYWPPSESHSAVTRLFRVLTPLTVVGSFALGLLDWEGAAMIDSGRFILGPTLFTLGGAFALWGYFGLGVSASQGRYEGLVARGAYRISRNPQYVGTIVCLLGHAVLCSSAAVLGVWALWTVWFLGAPIAEEPWLRAHLGHEYDEYASQVPRFIGWRSFKFFRAA